MFTELRLESFKCFESLQLPIRPFTLLAGVNGGGKSSIIQALVLLSHTLTQREWSPSLLLDGPDLGLGSVADVLNQHASRRRLGIGVATGEQSICWTFRAEDRQALSIELEAIEIDGATVEVVEPARYLLPLDLPGPNPVVDMVRALSWISAERTGPRELLPLRDPPSHATVGPRGELAAGLLYWFEDRHVRPQLRVSGQPPTLFHQVRARMQEFFPGSDLRVTPIDGASSVSLRLRLDPRSEFQRPQNVGFGLIQLFPILVAVLAATEGQCLLIENPEVHLHPRAQQHIGWLLALVAASGVQVIVETHSDHVLNGLRLAAKQGRIHASQVAVHFLAPDPQFLSVSPRSPSLDSDGRLSFWPEGFFDQLDLALAELL